MQPVVKSRKRRLRTRRARLRHQSARAEEGGGSGSEENTVGHATAVERTDPAGGRALQRSAGGGGAACLGSVGDPRTSRARVGAVGGRGRWARSVGAVDRWAWSLGGPRPQRGASPWKRHGKGEPLRRRASPWVVDGSGCAARATLSVGCVAASRLLPPNAVVR